MLLLLTIATVMMMTVNLVKMMILTMMTLTMVTFQFSVYFHATLSKQSTQNDMKTWLSKAPEDYFAR